MGFTEYEPGTSFPRVVGRTADESDPSWAFDDGWEVYRERPSAGQKELGIVPPAAEPSRHVSIYVQDGRLRYVHHWVGREKFDVASTEPLPPGDHELRFEFEPQGEPDLAQGHGMPGRLQLYVDNERVGAPEVPFTFNPGAQTCGADPGSAVTTAYPAPFRVTGTLHKVTVDLSGELIQDKDSELRVAMARQ